ncbi:MAG: hypothetical protein ACLU20_07510 [Thomasclavelia spiroformis]
MGMWTAENSYEKGYDSVVQYPFGYGLSYTDFEWTVDDIKIDGVSTNVGGALKENSKINLLLQSKILVILKEKMLLRFWYCSIYKWWN